METDRRLGFLRRTAELEVVGDEPADGLEDRREVERPLQRESGRRLQPQLVVEVVDLHVPIVLTFSVVHGFHTLRK